MCGLVFLFIRFHVGFFDPGKIHSAIEVKAVNTPSWTVPCHKHQVLLSGFRSRWQMFLSCRKFMVDTFWLKCSLASKFFLFFYYFVKQLSSLCQLQNNEENVIGLDYIFQSNSTSVLHGLQYSHFIEIAKSRSEYYHILVIKIYKIQIELGVG